MKRSIISILIIFLGVVRVFSQQHDDAAAAQANNPLANMTALNIQNYYVPKLTDAPDQAYMNTGWIRFARPFVKGKLLLRVSVPLSTIAMPDSTYTTVNSTNGLGDINAFVSYNFISKPKATVGIGPMITAPTAGDKLLGTGKWQGGLAFVAFIVQSPAFQLGGLITWQTSIAGDKDRPNTNMMALQPFYFWQLGKGTYLRGAPIWVFDFENEAYSTPVGLGIGKIVSVGKTTFNMFIEPQYTLLHKGTQPQFQVFMGINLQFTN